MENIKILVVDDESRMRKLVKDFLVREGYAVTEAGDGMEAMDIFYEEKSNIKPIANVEVENNEDYDSPVEKFLQEDSSDATYTNFLSKNPKSNGLEPNESGFDLKEAVNPTEDLEEIMKAFNFYPGKK